MKKYEIQFNWGRHSGIRPVVAESRYLAQMAIQTELTDFYGIEHEDCFFVLNESEIKEK